MKLPISPDLLHNELEVARAVLAKWADRVDKGLPHIDLPGDEDHLREIITEMRGELQIVVGKCDTLVEVLGGASL